MTRYLVAYYSWTGNTAKVAKVIAEALSADIEEIHDLKPRRGPFAFPAATLDSLLQKPTPIMDSTKSVANYDVVILGAPVWASNMATPMRSYIMREGPRIRQVGLFCTLGGSGGKAALARMASLCGHPSLADLIMDQSALASNSWRASTETFAREVQKKDLAAHSATAA